MSIKLLSVLAIMVCSIIRVNAQLAIITNNPICTGTANAFVAPTLGPYHYLWSNGSTLDYITSTVSGIYSCTVTDTVNHQVTVLTDTLIVPQPLTYTYSVTSPSSCDSCNGSISVVPSGGVPPYTIYWYDNSPTTLTHSNACAGMYEFDIADHNQCLDSMLHAPLNCNCGMNVTLSQNNISCDTAFGSVTANVAGGHTPYTYSWYDYWWGTSSTAPSFTHLATGAIWTLTITDSASCHYYATGNILNSLGYNYYVYAQPYAASCTGLGSAVAYVQGGYPPYSYLWSSTPQQTSATATSLSKGNYYVTVTDSLGCITAGTAMVDSVCYETISGTLFVDTTGNCNPAQGVPLPGFVVVATGINGTYYGTPNALGQYTIEVGDTGTYSLSAFIGYHQCNAGYTVCGNSSVSLLTAGASSTGNNIALAPNADFDLALHPGWTSAQPGFNKDYWIYFYDNNWIPFTGTATLTFQYDARLVFLGSDVPYTSYNASTHTLTWTATNIHNQPWSYIGRVHFYVPTTLSTNDVLISNFRIDPFTGDCDTVNNQMMLTEEVIGSRDPNEKDVLPAGSLTQNDSVLTYTIHFQNTGSATTSFITVIDSLPASVDPATVVNLASNPQYAKFNITGPGILNWLFSPAYLPDSLSDPNGSKGFVTFSVKLKKDLPLGQTINNSASVYFDYNSPVLTNTVSDTVAFATGIINPGNPSSVFVKVFPNPFNNTATFVVKCLTDSYDFELLDVTGRVQRKMSLVTAEQFTINRDGLAAGVYLFRISVRNQPAAYGKVVVQ